MKANLSPQRRFILPLRRSRRGTLARALITPVAHRGAAPQRAARGAGETPPLRPVRNAPPRVTEGRARGRAAAGSLLLHAVLLLACAWHFVLAPEQEAPPIRLTVLGTRDAGGGGGSSEADEPSAPLAAPPAAQAAPVDARPAPRAPLPSAVKPIARRATSPPPHKLVDSRAPQSAAPVPAPAREATAANAVGRGDQVAAAPGPGSGGASGSGTGRGHAPGVEGDPSSGSALGTYLSHLRQRLEAEKRYPLLARRRGVVGTATLHIAIGRDGRPSAVILETSSGSDVLDAEAEDLVSRAAPYGPLPDGVDGDALQITVPIRFDVDS